MITPFDGGEAVNAAATLGGRPVAALRVSQADPRERHRGVSHHSLTAYGRVALAPADVVVPALPGELGDLVRRQVAVLGGRHRLVTVPVDGLLEGDPASFDESSITGEPLPVEHRPGDQVLSGSVSQQRAALVRATVPAKDSQYQQIIDLVQAAAATKSPIVRLADRYAVPFTLVSLAIAGVSPVVADVSRRVKSVSGPFQAKVSRRTIPNRRAQR